MPNDATPVWFIADASAGLAAALAEAVLDAGQRAFLAAREPERLRSLVERHPGRAEAVALDVLDGAAVDGALRDAEARFGRIDVLAASAQQRYFGAVEEGDEAALRAVFEENVFAPVNLARRVLPGMRARRAGHIVLLARGAAHLPAGDGFCHAARSALEALAEALFHEVERFGIGVTLVDPGPGDDGRATPARAAGAAIADYADLAGRQSASGAPVDATRAAQAILRAVAGGRGPLRLVLGRAALQRAYDRLRILKVGFDAWAELAASADPDLPEAAPSRTPRAARGRARTGAPA
ncbi:SDR family NAD(P)-dependent oxidoreductase [Massilia sp. YIM B02763]|uniref:SDR family NAD(P)-dependent oxidoreductase n=1 Tax=Massilia sp. YIM B02763 TaxID=3050130 RepID=UPI0025B6E659|nr:SDR family NAD(P)-dependent oxidoreductase [Massilia sp. YIM B02763]MDN4055046.1 SDR family NAD(P)-dependent oxidoreductase [Massilia sp. YIM B02763]